MTVGKGEMVNLYMTCVVLGVAGSLLNLQVMYMSFLGYPGIPKG